MAFNSYIDFVADANKQPFKDIIFGVKDTIENDTLYIAVNDTKTIKMDNTSFAIGYTYAVTISVYDVDSPLVNYLSNVCQDGLNLVNWSENSHLYNYTGLIYIPIGAGGQPWQTN